MPPNASATAAPVTGFQQNPFARAIDSFLSDVKRSEDFKSPFFKEVLSQLTTLALHDGSTTQGHKSATDLVAFIEDMELQKRHTSKTLRVTNKLKPLVSALSQYVATIDVVIQAAPTAGVVLYCGARLVLQLAQNFYACFDKVLEIMVEIGHLLDCYRLFSTAFRASNEMQEILVDSYKNIVRFWQKACHVLGRKAYKTLLIGFIKPLDAEWQKCREGLDRDRIRVQALAQATESDLRQQSELRKAETQRGEQRRRLVEWLRSGDDLANLDIRVDLRTNLGLHQTGTCTWILEDPSYKSWYDSNANAALWYHAGPGSGKTVLSSVLIKHLEGLHRNTIYFFFTFNDPRRRKAINALRSLSLQLLTQSDTIPDQVIRLYEADLAHNVSTLQDQETAMLVLQAFLRQSSRVHIILDGLDECCDGPKMIDTFVDLFSTTTYGISKWFFTSRDEQHIKSIAEQVGAISVAPSVEVLMCDIRRYVKDHTADEELPQGCVNCWTASSEGNFLWISLMLKTLTGMELTCDEDIEEELERFPKGLTGCYIRSLQQISTLHPKQQELARRIFTILVVAEQPLHLSELSNALGIRECSEDYSAKRVPRRALIESLCSHLVIFDRTVQGGQTDPILKFAHKSIKDFFIQDPHDLDVTENLYPFFVNFEAGNLELGKACVRYLNYERYHKPRDCLHVLDSDPGGEHAFLKYAAIFWFQHLMYGGHSRSLFEFVEKFVRSPAFWTCIAVQCKVAPHLFAPLIERNNGHFHLGEGCSGDSNNEEKLNFAFPLPHWLEEYSPAGPAIIQEFLAFIKEWHPVLTSSPQAINQCQTEGLGYSTYLSHNPFDFKGTKIIKLTPGGILPRHFAILNIQCLALDRDDLSVSTIEEQITSFGRVMILRCMELATEELLTQRAVRKQIRTLGPTSCDIQICFNTNAEQVSIWSLDLLGLCLEQQLNSTETVYFPGGAIENIKAASKTRPLAPWVVSLKGSNLTAYGTVFYFHCIQNVGPVRAESDSGYGTSRENLNSDSDSDSESYNEDEEGAEAGDNNLPVKYHCLVLGWQGGTPLWFSWQTDAVLELQVVPANHPIKPITVWSYSSHEFCMADLSTGLIASGILPEPVDIQIGSAAAVRKEFHFSTDGKILYYLLCAFVDGNETGSTCSVSVSSFDFGNELDAGEGLQRVQPAQHITYEVGKTVKGLCAPYLLTHWSSTHLYIALPSLSCSPKIVRFTLAPGDVSFTTTGMFQTLNSDIYFPSSAPARNPKLFVQTTATAALGDQNPSPCERLILALDQRFSYESIDKNVTSVLPPVLMTWSLSEMSSWRDWKPELDGRSPECESSVRAYDILRGTFVDSEQRFSIPIRSGLDWRKKAFVSCA